MSWTSKKIKKQQKRKKRDHEEALKHEAELGTVRHFLQRIGVWKDLQAAHVGIADLWFPRRKIIVERGEDVPLTPKTTTILTELQAAVDNASFEFVDGNQMRVQDFWRLIRPLLGCLAWGETEESQLAELQKKIRPLVAPFLADKYRLKVWGAIDFGCFGPIINASRVNDTWYYLVPGERDIPGKWSQTFLTLRQEKSRAEKVVVDGAPRIAFPCAYQTAILRTPCVTWSGEILGHAKARKFPVLVQEHALNNIYGSEGRVLPGSVGFEAGLHWFLCRSLKWPILHPLPDRSDSFLVEYRVFDKKLGYLVGRVVDGKVLIRTFLFLTMDGTPEGTQLWKQLRLRRQDKEFLGLDKLKTFLTTDVRSDPTILAILEKCNCAHLCSLAKVDFALEPGYADNIKRYLNLPYSSKPQKVENLPAPKPAR